MPRTRIATLAGIAAAARADRRLFDPRGELADAVAALSQIDGIGPWTAHYIAMAAWARATRFWPMTSPCAGSWPLTGCASRPAN